MSFSSLIFTAFFLPVFMLASLLVSGNARKNVVLLVFSLIFYAFAGLSSLILLLLIATLAWALGQRIGKALQFAASANPDYQEGDDDFQSPLAEQLRETGQKRAKLWLLLALVLLVGVLLLFKCAAPFCRTLSGVHAGAQNAGAGTATNLSTFFLSIGLPLGMSFYIFKLISYVVDVYTGKTEPGDFFHVLLYTVCFHQVTQGPITRYGEMAEEMEQRSCTAEDIVEGSWRFTVGLAKKTVLADQLGTLAESFLPIAGNTGFSVGGAYLGSLCYMLQLYLDFSAYSDMALGLGRMIGFHYPENFNYPYIAGSVRDFWRRWHISLSRFFRDYVYIPLGGNRVSTGRLLLNLLVVWALTGFWHGSSWNFILWGLYYFVFIALEDLVKNRGTRPRALQALGHVYTLLVVFFGWVLFRFSDVHVLGEVLRTLLFQSDRAWIDTSELLTLRSNLFFLLLALLACTPAGKYLAGKLRALYDAGLQKEAREKQQLVSEKERYQKETAIDRQLQRLDASTEGFEAEDAENHARVTNRLQRRISKSTHARQRSEALYYGIRTVLLLILLGLSIVSMVGASYTPFLYNQF